jgi:hypothetical protein
MINKRSAGIIRLLFTSVTEKEIPMQLRCSYCQTMFAISREETLAAIEHMADNNLKYYDAHCPNCRRANRVERFKLEASYPGWQAAIKTMTKEADKADVKPETSPAAAPKKAPSKEKPAAAASPKAKKK